jgi:hypothetical protein
VIPVSASAFGRVGGVLDFLVRLAFFAAAPFVLVLVASLFPVTGALVQIGLGLVAFFAGEALRRVAERSKLVGKALSSQLAFEAHYRAHRPRPFLYYVFYPVLFPYWLAVPDARREFLLYKGYTLVSFGMLIVSQVVGYVRYFPPELGWQAFLPLAAGTFAVETAVVLMFLMPIVTTVVHFHTLRAPRRLGALMLVGLLSVSFAVVRLERRRDPVVSYAARNRVDMRTKAKPAGAQQAQIAGLRAAWKALPKDKTDVDHDGKVEGDVLEAAQDAMATQGFYKNDEAHAFDLWYVRNGKISVMVLYFEARGKKDPIWLAMTGGGAVTHDAKQLPKNAFNAMWKLTQ